MGETLTIGKVAKATGLTLRAIRYYENKGLLPARRRTNGGYRQYEEADVKRLLFIRRAKGLGISLRQIAGLLECWPERCGTGMRPALKKTMRGRIAELDAQISLLASLRAALEEELEELERRPDSDHSQGYCECLGELNQIGAGPGTDGRKGEKRR